MKFLNFYCSALLLFFTTSLHLYGQDCGCDHYVKKKGGELVNIYHSSEFDYQPGDVFCIESGLWNAVRFIGFKGSEEKPLVFTNCDGVVEFNSPQYSGIHFIDSRFIRITGEGNGGNPYGLEVSHTGKGSPGIAINGLSSDIEIDHIEIYNTGFAGITAKTDPDCNDPETWRENFTMYNINIHDNYIHDTEGEGLYIGYTGGFATSNKSCEGEMIFGHLIKGVKIYNNILERTGWDGIQLNMAVKDVEVYNNKINTYGVKKEKHQNFGMSIGGGSVGRYYNNQIINSQEFAIGGGVQIINNQGGTYFYNNIIKTTGEYGIFLHLRSDQLSVIGGYHFLNNLIIDSGNSGIFYNSCVLGGECRTDIAHSFYNNIIINPGVKYENGNLWKGVNENYIDFNTKILAENAIKAKNVFSLRGDTLGFYDFENQDYRLVKDSYLVDAGFNVAEFDVQTDLAGNFRPLNGIFDIGPYEYYNEKNPPVNIKPLQNKTIKAGEDINYSVPSGTFIDPDNDELTYTVEVVGMKEFPEWLELDVSKLHFSGIPQEEHVGRIEIKITATDPSGESVSGQFFIDVKPGNQPPVIGADIPEQSAPTNEIWKYYLPPTTFIDPDDNNHLNIKVSLSNGDPLPDWLAFDPEKRSFEGMPSKEHIGIYNIKASASDPSGAEVSINFKLDVVFKNHSPVIKFFPPDISLTAEQPVDITISPETFYDADEDTLTYSATLKNSEDLPIWLTFDDENLRFYGMPEEDQNLQYVISLTATDPYNEIAEVEFTISFEEKVYEDDKDVFYYYPNPLLRNHPLTIETTIESVVFILDGAGKEMYSQKITQYETIDLNLNQGIYFLVYQMKDQVHINKLVVL